MIREVYINNQLIDIEAGNVAGYIFTSPIFRDISKIVSNRTTTYKIPKTTRNLSIFGLADNPDVDSLAPYREHTFKEYRDGLPFIEGVCYFLKTADKELELAVFWGNSEKLQALKDIKLRDLRFKDEDIEGEEGFRYITWDGNSSFLKVPAENKSGFLKIDFGRGVDNMQFIHPCVNVQYILDLIKSSTGITIGYEAPFKEEFKKKWFPLIEKKANLTTWNNPNYRVSPLPSHVTTYESQNYSILNFEALSNHIIGSGVLGDYIKAQEGSTIDFVFANLKFKAEEGLQGAYEMKMYLGQGWEGEVYAEKIVNVTQTSEGMLARFTGSLSFKSSKTEGIYIKLAIRKAGETRWQNLRDKFTFVRNDTILNQTIIYVRYDEVRFGDKYPIISNLPDLSVLEFLKSLMSMYGLFTYHSFANAPDAVKFVSIDEMYNTKADAYDWTNKLVLTNRGRMLLEYTYGEYARKNKLKYKNDKDITINADGFIQVDNESLPKEKDLIELPYSPSDNTADEFDNTYAKIPLYDGDGKYSSVGVRILNEGVYKKEDLGEKLKAAAFNEELRLSGNKGLIKRFYSRYQAVMLHPVVASCAVYLSDVELHQFKENNPVHIDGVYYMPITVTIQTNGLAICKLIKMPYMKY